MSTFCESRFSHTYSYTHAGQAEFAIEALAQHWERERAIDPSFVQRLEAEGVNLAYALPLRIYGDGAQALRIFARTIIFLRVLLGCFGLHLCSSVLFAISIEDISILRSLRWRLLWRRGRPTQVAS